MGCCFSRTDKREKYNNNPNFDYSTENTTGNRSKLFTDNIDILDTIMGNDLVKRKERYNSEESKFFNYLDFKDMTEGNDFTDEEELPTFNYRAIIRDKKFIDKDNQFYIENIENASSNLFETSLNRDHDYSFEEEGSMSMEKAVNLKNEKINVDEYFSINSTSILGNSVIKCKNEDNNQLEIKKNNKIQHSNVFSKNNFVFLYIEINYFIFWARDYIISLYPEINLIMIIEINDNKLTQEKIHFIRSKEDASKYFPIKTKTDLNANCSRLIKAFELDMLDLDAHFKLSISFYTYSNHKLLIICNDEIFVKITKEGEMQKYKMYQNIHMKHYNKKVGNLMFNFAYKSKEIYANDLEEEKSENLFKFYKLEKFSKLEEEDELIFIYNGVENLNLNANQNLNNKNEYFSIRDIEEIDLNNELKGELKLDRLLELLTTVQRKIEFYQILKQINNYLSKKEFKEDKLISFKEILLRRVNEILENLGLVDKILLPYIFTTLKKACFKIKNSSNSKGVQRKASGKSLSGTTNLDYEKIQQRQTELLISFFSISLKFLQVNIQEDISLSALNYISKHFEESISIKLSSGKTTTTDEYFLEYIVVDKYYTKFCDLLLKYFEYQSCVQPVFGIFSRIIKFKKTQCQDLIAFINTEKFIETLKKIVRIHDCNSLIMSNIFSTMNNLIDHIEVDKVQFVANFQKMKEIFSIFKMTGFDQVHETIIILLKSILAKRTEKILKPTNRPESDQNGKAEEGQLTKISDEEYADIVAIFSNALLFIRNKILMCDFFRLSKVFIYNLLNQIYTIAFLINNTNPKNFPKMITILTERKIGELVIDCFSAMNEKKIFIGIDTAYNDFLDLNLINTKIMIFRTLYHSILLIKILKDISSNFLSRQGAEKLLTILTIIEDNDLNYNPDELFKVIEKNKSRKPEQYVQNLLLLHKNLQDYYKRYKSKAPEFMKEFLIYIKK